MFYVEIYVKLIFEIFFPYIFSAFSQGFFLKFSDLLSLHYINDVFIIPFFICEKIFRMILKSWVLRRIKFYLNPELDAKSVLDDQELAYVRENGQQAYIRDYLFVPTHKRPTKTYRIQKVLVKGFNIFEFIHDFTSLITGEFHIAIDLGYFVTKPSDGDSLRFVFPSKTNAFIKAYVPSKEKLEEFYKDLEEKSKDVLGSAFSAHMKLSEKFKKSQLTKRTAAVLHIYITRP